MSKKILSLILSAMLIIALAGCDKSQNEETSSQNQSQENSEFLEHSDMFTSRDKEIGYDESTATKINLDEKPDGVTITAEGTYILTGKLENGQVVVDADKTAKIQLVLNGVNINCDTSASIYIKQADKVFITLANGSENTLSNKAEFVAIDENNIDGVIFSKDDLTLNGAG
ncbi:MAG: carbohydrate-binding domain-containing protein, partial [Oscillospiraceae bacterium]|nr:carbohydrate-binding domain-containing protein [Oscillospiraceae bacterium]